VDQTWTILTMMRFLLMVVAIVRVDHLAVVAVVAAVVIRSFLFLCKECVPVEFVSNHGNRSIFYRVACIFSTHSNGKKKRRRYDASWMYDNKWNR
jgi:hypothetical protein